MCVHVRSIHRKLFLDSMPFKQLATFVNIIIIIIRIIVNIQRMFYHIIHTKLYVS